MRIVRVLGSVLLAGAFGGTILGREILGLGRGGQIALWLIFAALGGWSAATAGPRRFVHSRVVVGALTAAVIVAIAAAVVLRDPYNWIVTAVTLPIIAIILLADARNPTS